MDNLDQFVEEYVDSFAAWDILTLFGGSPNRLALASDIAASIGRPEDAVETALASLSEKGFFRREESGDRTYYHWGPDSELSSWVKRFAEATRDRRGRLQALSILLRKVGSTDPRGGRS